MRGLSFSIYYCVAVSPCRHSGIPKLAREDTSNTSFEDLKGHVLVKRSLQRSLEDCIDGNQPAAGDVLTLLGVCSTSVQHGASKL